MAKSTTVLSVLLSLAAGAGCVAGTHSESGNGGRGGSSSSTGGGGSTGTTGGGGGGPAPTGRGGSGGSISGYDAGTCNRMDFMVDKKPANVFLVQDRSGSMKNTPTGQTQTKWDLTTKAMIQAIMQTDSAINWGMKSFPEDASCAVSSAIDVQVAKANASNVVGKLQGTMPDGDGTPTGEAIHEALAYMATVTLPGDKYLVLSTDGDPTCSGAPSPIAYAVSQLQMGAAMGLKTFVIGIGTGSTSGPNLNMMADAGGIPRPVVNPLDTKYYLANSQQELAAALAAITGQVISCTFPLKDRPEVPNGVHVKVNDVEIYADANHASGWDYTDAGLTGLTIYGPQCDVVKTGDAQVHITYDCKPVIPE